MPIHSQTGPYIYCSDCDCMYHITLAAILSRAIHGPKPCDHVNELHLRKCRMNTKLPCADLEVMRMQQKLLLLSLLSSFLFFFFCCSSQYAGHCWNYEKGRLNGKKLKMPQATKYFVDRKSYIYNNHKLA